MSRPIRIHIDRLVLDPAFAHLDREVLGAAVEGELSRLLAEGGPPGALEDGGRRGRVDGGRFDAPPGTGAEAVGRQVAEGVYRGLSR